MPRIVHDVTSLIRNDAFRSALAEMWARPRFVLANRGVCIDGIRVPDVSGAPTRDPSYPQQGMPQHTPRAQHAAANAVGEAAKAVLLTKAAPMAANLMMVFICNLLKF